MIAICLFSCPFQGFICVHCFYFFILLVIKTSKNVIRNLLLHLDVKNGLALCKSCFLTAVKYKKKKRERIIASLDLIGVVCGHACVCVCRAQQWL